MSFLFYFGHPAQYLFLRETIRQLSRSKNHRITILIKTKDVLEDLIRSDGFQYTNILTKQRGGTRLAIVLSYLKRVLFIAPIILRKKPNLLVGTDATIAQLGKLFGINRITVIEDDYEVIRNLANVTYPLTQTILCPDVCQVGPWTAKKIGYRGYMKLGYLHPAVFRPDETIRHKYGLPERYVLIRLTRLTAYHDYGIRGISPKLLQDVIHFIEAKGIMVKITMEAAAEPQFGRFLLNIKPGDMHHVLAQSTLLISDGQSMCVEASMLGIPSIRYNDFVGKISVLEELEHTYALTYGIPIGSEKKLFAQITALIEQPDLTTVFQDRRKRMLGEKINVTAFLVWFLENYPRSLDQMKANPEHQTVFINHAYS